MKRIHTFLLLTMLAGAPAAAQAGDGTTGYLPGIDIRDRKVTRENREVELTMVVDLSRLRLRTQHSVALVPVLVSEDGSREATFPAVVIDGRTRNKVYQRAQRLESVAPPLYHDGSAQTVIRRDNGEPQSYGYRAALPYERWMLGGRIEIRERVSGCANCEEEGGSEPVHEARTALAPFVPDYRIARVEPEPEPVKQRAEERVARLRFRQGSHELLPEFGNNRSELEAVSASIELVKNDADLTITGIHITGYASPEGSEALNLTLSENRAKALVEYIHRHDAISPELLHVAWKGEDWEGFVRMAGELSPAAGGDRIRELIGRYPDNHDFCEMQIRKLEPASIYRHLLDEVYPTLRRNEYRIEYNVRNFDVEEAKRQILERPELLSLAEMHAVAEAYGEGSEEYLRTMRIAARTYPGKRAAAVNAARAELERGDAESAIRLLEASPAADAPEVLNALGVAYAAKAEYGRAHELLERAAAAGSPEAEHNLKQVAGMTNDL